MAKLIKKGFTLMEILIAMALVGILVAIMSPNLAKVLPDKKKAMFIKAFTRTELAVSAMLADPDMYRNVYDYATVSFKNFGLCNTDEPKGLLKATGNVPAAGENKFVFYFAQQVGGVAPEGSTDVETGDGLVYAIEWQGNDGSTDRDADAAIITVKLKEGNTVSDGIASIDIKNDGTILCGDDKCTEYMEDRFNLKKK